MAVSKVILNDETLMDVTQDSVTASTLLSGETATGANGVRLTGTATVPEPSSTTPAMDGTAAVGTATTYARADHVHPSDTSKQDALVSGTNIKTINGDSILGSGDLTISGGGGGMLVTFTTPDGGGTYTADKTFGEIFAAFDSGIQPVFKFISSSTATAYTTIKDASTNGSSTPYGILFSNFYTTRLFGAANDYPSWENDN